MLLDTRLDGEGCLLLFEVFLFRPKLGFDSLAGLHIGSGLGLKGLMQV